MGILPDNMPIRAGEKLLSNDREAKSYEQLFILFSAKVEKVIIRTTLVCFIVLICVQLLLQIPYVRKHFTRVEPLEGKPYMLPQNAKGERS
ncbi:MULTISPECIES: hypothetical protein [Paenibacillus]|uniref:Uncharacterized protein n=2 Tax=Paenibacillus TaxID=44249 RepID=A0ABU6DNH2_9BACL|nr:MULTISPECIES: hypothetical protein [Paenibacillus]MCY9657098.1 hypothetical protein [Paenibacillus anseongense]MEB4798381.1 hypothetical protein [Paenibacillus chondroitinus]